MRLSIAPRAAAAVRRGHPWVFREAITENRGHAPETGQVVDLYATDTASKDAPRARTKDDKARPSFVGRGLYDARSPIAVRVYGREEAAILDASALAKLVDRAARAREGLFDSELTNAYRLCNGEGDRAPGIVVDRYADIAILRTDGDAMALWVDRLAPRLTSLLESRGVRSLHQRIDAEAGASKARKLWGTAAPETIDVAEHGMILEVDVHRGQKTGAFLDQRENRRRVRELSAGRGRVLNLFSYTGGFSLAAALGGAGEVTSVDTASAAHATAQRIFRKNDLDPKTHRFVSADALTYVDELDRRGERFDIVISDPPSFARNERSVERALGAYARLHKACAKLVADGGVLCAASCSSHVSMEAFLGTLDDFALGRSDLRLRSAVGPPADHPSLPAFPEGRYLKFAELA